MAIKKSKQITCTCKAYSFPHRFGGGKCNGYFLVKEYWEQYYGYSEHCHMCPVYTGSGCQVVEGIEDPAICGFLDEWLQDNKP